MSTYCCVTRTTAYSRRMAHNSVGGNTCFNYSFHQVSSLIKCNQTITNKPPNLEEKEEKKREQSCHQSRTQEKYRRADCRWSSRRRDDVRRRAQEEPPSRKLTKTTTTDAVAMPTGTTSSSATTCDDRVEWHEADRARTTQQSRTRRRTSLGWRPSQEKAKNHRRPVTITVHTSSILP